MIFKCKNCGGNVIYDPSSKMMKCPHCESEESQEIIAQESTVSCVNCGAEIEKGDLTSATKCEHCGTYVLVNENLVNEKRPNLVIPFAIDKNKAADILRKRFKKKMFAPSDFLSSTTLEKMEGLYVPFWLYDYDTHVNYNGIGIKIRKWTSGDIEYTETSRYSISRELDIKYEKLPVDASNDMNDIIMQEIEPYDYKEIIDFDPKFLSGFYSEVYSKSSNELKSNAEARINKYTKEWVMSTTKQYNRVEMPSFNVDMAPVQSNFALFPVWIYTYRFKGENIRYYVNGQTGEVVGSIPISIGRTLIFGIIEFILSFLCLNAVLSCMGVF